MGGGMGWKEGERRGSPHGKVRIVSVGTCGGVRNINTQYVPDDPVANFVP